MLYVESRIGATAGMRSTEDAATNETSLNSMELARRSCPTPKAKPAGAAPHLNVHLCSFM